MKPTTYKLIEKALYDCHYLLLKKHKGNRKYRVYTQDLLSYYNSCVKNKVFGFEDLPKLTIKDLKVMGF